ALAGAALALGALWPAAGMAQTWQLSANLLANAVQFTPGSGLTVSNNDDLNLLNQPGANQLQVRSELSETPVGGRADARFMGRVGLLKAYAAASNPYCCDLQGHVLTIGYSNATVLGRFYDTVLVGGAGLAAGTPVSYQVEVDISGSLSRPVFELGGFLSVDGLAELRLRDLTSFQEVALNWNASKEAPGRYVLTLATQVGHSLGMSGMLYAGAYVSSYAQLGRSAVADFSHSAAYSLTPSVAGLNTVGASGHDFLAAPVPEPATWASMLLGLAALGGLARVRRCGPRAC
ncbi:MAG: PEP-CTERM sorting domain-containing protein, partial [Aquabacterium sp.]|nr:PEP-CTERM sorting domain-containing protein [Aquabacterium sp.]